MHYTKTLFITLLVLSFTFMFTACDDNDAPGIDDPSDVPSPPDFSQMQMETDIFTYGKTLGKQAQQQAEIRALHKIHPDLPVKVDPFTVPGLSSETTSEAASPSSLIRDLRSILTLDYFEEELQAEQANPFMLATMLVMMFESAYNIHVNYANFFTLNALPDGVEVSGDEFLWDYSFQDPELGETIHISVSAMVSGQNVNWNVIASADFDDGGFEEQQIIDGTSSLDGSTGEWSITFDVPEEGFTFESNVLWELDGENVEELDIFTSLTENETDFYLETKGVYSLDGTSAAISNAQVLSAELEGESPFGDIDVTQPFTVSWDTGTETGMISIDGHTLCWDENKMGVDC